MSVSPDAKVKFLIGSSHADIQTRLSALLEKNISNAVIFFAEDGINVLQKIENDPPHVLLIEADLSKKSGVDVVESIIRRGAELPAIVILSTLPDDQHFINEIAVGRVQILALSDSDERTQEAIARALNWVGKGGDVEFTKKFLSSGDVLIRKGDKADFVYILQQGTMEALVHHGALEVVLGQIGPHEFVGEMAFVTGDVRSADVVAKTSCELIEIPIGHLDRLLFKKPAWAKALMKTLAKRIKNINDARTQE